MPRVERPYPAVAAFLAVALLVPFPTAAGEADLVTIRLTDTRFDCKEPFVRTADTGFEACEVRTVPRFTAPASALLKVFGHCEVTVRYKTQSGVIEHRDTLYEKFYGAVVDGAGLAPVTMTFRPTGLTLDPIVEAKATDLRCSIDEAFSY